MSRTFIDHTEIDHAEAVRNHLAERYVMGNLDAPNTAAYQAHLVTCPYCITDVKAWRKKRDQLEAV